MRAQEDKLVMAKAFEQIGIPRQAIYRLARKGRIPYFRVGSRGAGLRFRIDEVLEALRVKK